MSRKKKVLNNANSEYISSEAINNATFEFWLEQFNNIATSIFEYENVPDSLDMDWLEQILYYNGIGAILEDDKRGIINTSANFSGDLNIYGLPTKINCYSFDFNTSRNLYTGLKNESEKLNSAILVMNNRKMIPTFTAMEFLAYKMYCCDRTIDLNIDAQKMPIIIQGDEKSLLSLKNLYAKYDGNQKFIIIDKNNITGEELKVLKTDAPYVADKIQMQKKEIINEALTYLGVNNINTEKKERLISDEANSNNEVINLNLQHFFKARQKMCKQFNDLFTKNMTVKLSSDLNNKIKNLYSIVSDTKAEGDDLNVNRNNSTL